MFNLFFINLVVLYLVNYCFSLRFINYKVNSLFINNFSTETSLINDIKFEEYENSSRFINKSKESSSKGDDNSGEVEDSSTHPSENVINTTPDVNSDLTISKRMVNSILSLLSSFYEPDFYDIIPILYNIKDEVINITEYMGNTQVKTSQRKHPEKTNNKLKDKTYKINEEMYDKINGMFMTDPSGEVESLVLSIPSSIMNRLYQSSHYGHKGESTIPQIQLVTLSSGFFTKLYEIAIFPYLSELFQKCFNTTLDNTFGLMHRIITHNSSEENDVKSEFYTGIDKIPGFLLTPQLEKSLTEEFENAFRINKLKPGNDVDLTVFSKDSLFFLTVLIKCMKDLVYFNSSLKLLEQLIGRKPTDNEIIFSFFNKSQTNLSKSNKAGTDGSENNPQKQKSSQEFNVKKLVQIITDSEFEIEHRLDLYFTPFVEAVTNIFKKKINSEFFKVLFACQKDALAGVKTRLFAIKPKTIDIFGTRFIHHLFSVSYHHVKMSALRQNLPEHLPIGTLRLAKKGLKLYEYLEKLQDDIIYRLKKNVITKEDIESLYEDHVDSDAPEESGNTENKRPNPTSTRIDIDEKKYKEFIRKVIEIENRFNKRPGDKTCNDNMRKQQQEELLKNTAAKILNVTTDRLSEAIDAYYSKEVSPRDKIPKYLKSRFNSTGRPGRAIRYYADLEPYDIYERLESIEYFRDMIYRRTLRKLAMEALDDRLARILFMAQNSLFCEVHPNYEEVIADLKIPKKTADFIAFAATLMCKQYEVWRIKLNLPPYVNEFRVNPGVLKVANLDPNDLPYHISTAMYNIVKTNLDPALMNDPSVQIPGGPAKNKRDRFNRMRLIKPNLSDMNESFMNYKANYKEYERILLKSPIYYLQFSGKIT
ncbi:putative integral membrane protein [Theileria parva strain Muguga]|uniref:Uncharacterized protein n=1 Tax=Theileria parva TaxID=5875 RepID=Q4N7C3_THEPA|nr:putative integral membrane protein [Theileria parva strain Muguga]EAN34135.1 putative integral membrane protein [Theileria parva strain Muguga]|eukprot:XP_766418.1 hypothetical protein [Theileria parva strain Muguga]